MGYTICRVMFGNGVPIGTRPISTNTPPRKTQRGRVMVHTECCEEDPGTTIGIIYELQLVPLTDLNPLPICSKDRAFGVLQARRFKGLPAVTI